MENKNEKKLIKATEVYLLMSVCLGCSYNTEEKNEYSSPNNSDKQIVSQEITANADVIDKNKVDYFNVRSEIENIIGDETDEYSVYLWYPKSGENTDTLVINNKSRRSASMIKVFIMSYAMELASKGQLNLDNQIVLKSSDKVGGAGVICGWSSGTEISIYDLLSYMITESDNTATNMMIDYLGMDNINSYIKKEGYNETVLGRKMMDFDAIAAGRENYSSVSDLGKFFQKLVRNQCVNSEYDTKMIDILLQQTDKEVFPTALGDVKIAHKTGELDNLYDDGGIIYSPRGEYVLVVMNDGVGRSSAVKKMQKIASATYTSIE